MVNHKILDNVSTLGETAFMLPMVILLMSVMMIVGSAALMQATNTHSISIGINDLSSARSAAKAGSEYAQVAFVNSSCWFGTDNQYGGNGPQVISGGDDSKEKVDFVVVPAENVTPNDCNNPADIEVTITGRVFKPGNSASPKKTYSIKSNISKYSSLGQGFELAGGGHYLGISGVYRVTTPGKDILLGIYGNIDRGNHFLCIDLSKPDNGNNTQGCEGPDGQVIDEVTYVSSDPGEDKLGEGQNNFMSVGVGGNMGGKPYFDTSTGDPSLYGRFYYAVHNLGPWTGSFNPSDDKVGYACVEVTVVGVVRPCSNGVFKQLDTGAPAAPSYENQQPNNMIYGPVNHGRKLYSLVGSPKTGYTKSRVFCWDMDTSSVCGEYATRLPTFLANQHYYLYDPNNGNWGSRYGMYAMASKDPNSTKIYWAINYSTFSTLRTVTWGNDNCWDLICVRYGSQSKVGTRIDCFDVALNLPCSMAASSVLDGGDSLLDVVAMPETYHVLAFQPFYMRDSLGNPTGLCLSFSRNPYYTRYNYVLGWIPESTNPSSNRKAPLKCYDLTTGLEINSSEKDNLANGIEGTLHGAYNLGIPFEDRGEFGSGNRTYFAFTALDHPIVFEDWKVPEDGTGRNRSVGVCWDWSKPNGGGRCDSWQGNVTWPEAPPSVPPQSNMDVNLVVGGFTSDGKCLIAISANDVSAGLFAIKPSTGQVGCSPKVPRRIF